MPATTQFAAARGSLRAESLTKRFGNTTLWQGVNLTAKPGTITSLVGPSGAGKTTLLNCLGLLEPVDSGSVHYADAQLVHARRVTVRRLYRTAFGFLFQNYALVEQWSIAQNLTVVPRVRRLPRNQRAQIIGDALDALGLAGRERDHVFSLSGGEQQRVALARLLLHRPEVVFVDEPTASLDLTNAEMVLSHLRRLAEHGAIVVISTHDDTVKRGSDQLIELPEGLTSRCETAAAR